MAIDFARLMFSCCVSVNLNCTLNLILIPNVIYFRCSETWERSWDINVNEGYDPSSSLLIALVCSSVLSPEKITRYLSVKWP